MGDGDRELEPSRLAPAEMWLAERLRIAREYVGLTQGAVATVLDIPRSAVSAMESGKRRITFLELQQLAHLYRQPLSYFSDQEQQEGHLPADDLSRALHRATQKLGDKDRHQVLLFARFLHNAGSPRESDDDVDSTQ